MTGRSLSEKHPAGEAAILEEIRRGAASQVYLIHGAEEFLVGEAARRIVKELTGKESKEAGLVRCEEDTIDWKALIARLRTGSLFERRLVFLVPGAGIFEEAVSIPLQQVVETGFGTANILVITAQEVDRRRSVYRAIRKAGRVLDFSPGRSEQQQLVNRILRERLGESGKEAAREVIDRLKLRVGTNLRRLASEIEKLILFVGDRRDIRIADVDALVGVSREEQIFHLTGALGSGDYSAAAVSLRHLLAQGEPYMRILGSLRRQFEKILGVRSFLEGDSGSAWRRSMSYPDFERRFLPAWKEKQDRGEIPAGDRHPFALYKTVQQADRFNSIGVESILRRLLVVNRAIVKGAGSPPLLIEDLLYQVCAVQSDRRSSL